MNTTHRFLGIAGLAGAVMAIVMRSPDLGLATFVMFVAFAGLKLLARTDAS